MTAHRRLATIGVYGFDRQSFLDELTRAGVTTLLDVRQRRGVRGPQYAWANSQRLQTALAEAGIEYRHLRSLAPTTALRQVQYAEDDRTGVGKRSRQTLAPAYASGYTAEILDHADLASVVAMLPAEGMAALLCVETAPEACHRSLVADRMAERFQLTVTHLSPDADEAAAPQA